ncbi:MAG: hypothetical protein JW788_01175 [Candidatus Omnitrophica bacterium]|nr:hypothetical protein [Candidatus Omnitrophota bacterium]
MKKCKYCQKDVQEEEKLCPFCGYDFKSGTITQVFSEEEAQKRKRAEKKISRKEGGIDPRIKKFAFIGIAITIFSVLYSYNFRLNIIFFDFKDKFLGGKKGGLTLNSILGKKKKDQKIENIQLTDISSFNAPREAADYKNFTLEGIFFDPQGESYATINGQVLAEGESLENLRVKKINKNTVEIEIAGKVQILEVNQEIPKK